MDPLMLSKIGNVTIQRLPLKQDDTDEIENSSMVSEPSSPALQNLQLPKLPPSINITIKSTHVVHDSTNNIASTVVEQEESQEMNRNSDSDYSGKLPITDEENLDNSETEICDKIENAQDDDKLQKIVGKTTDLDEGVDSEGLATVKMLQSAAVIEELPSIKEELMDTEEFQKSQLEIDENEKSTNTVANELSEGMICKEEKYSDDEGELETDEDNESDEADDEHDERQPDKKNIRKKKRKPRSKVENKDSKKQKKSQDNKNSDGEETEKTPELKVGNLRKNIREVMDETKLDEATLAAQLQEKERLRRVQEQLRANRDIQRQARVISRFEKALCTPIKEEAVDDYETEEQKPNTVVVKLTTGSSNQMLDMLKKHKNSSTSEDEDMSLEKFKNLSNNLSKPHMMTASVSIVPVSREQKTEEVPEPTEEETPDDKAKGKDVVMISSDEDDCIVISEEEDDSEPEEDTANSGMHTNDQYNVPDAMGRVLINVGHPGNEEDVFLAPQIARIIKPHQIGGVRFLYDNIVESLDRYRTSEGFGCILAHSMGLGKTLQVISFSDVFLHYTEGKTILCIMPINTLQNWVSEFNKWLPVDPENSPLKKDGEVSKRQFPLFVLNDNQKTLSARAKVISQWHEEGGVLLMGYELFRQLSLKKSPKSRTRSKKRPELEEDVTDEKSKTLLETMHNALVNPGPDLVICDEGHRIKNSHASISQALKQIRSKRRVVLTGYPLQNNLLEYWCMVDFVRPNYLGSKTEFSNMFERPIQNGQCIDSTPQDVKLMRFRAHVLHSLLEGFVQRRSHSVLQQTLPSKYEFVMLLRFTPFQRQLYNTFMNEVVRTKAVPNPLKAFAVCCKIWNHPDILYNFLKKRAGDEDIDLDLDDTTSSLGVSASGPSTPMNPATPPQQSITKRGRNRSTKGSQSKNAKVPRKKNCESTSESQPASITNTASTAVSDPAEQTTVCNQPVPPFNSFNNMNNNALNDTNVGLSYVSHQSDNAGQNFSNQYNKQPPPPPQQPTEQSQQQRQEYNVQPTPSNVDFSTNVNFQQNYNENRYYQPEYAQNYWQGNNNNNNNNNPGFTSSTTSGSDSYYQAASQNTQQQQPQQQQQQQQYVPAGDYSTTNEVTSQAGYNNHNYNFDLNQQQQIYSNVATPTNVGDFTSKGEINSMNSFGVGDNNLLLANNNMFGDSTMNYDIGSNINQLNEFQGAGTRAPPPTFNSPVFQNPPQIRPKRPGRPPLSQARTRGASMNPRSGVAGKKRGSAGSHTMRNTNNLACFRPGLPGGAPILKADGQNYSLGESDTNNTFASQSFNLDSINNEELWNPGQNDQNSMFEQTFSMYGNQGTDPNNAFMQTESSNLLGGVRASRGLLNDIQTDEIFNPAPSQPSVYAQGSDTTPNLYIDNYNYLDSISIPSQSSFMGLLQHEDGVNTQEAQNMENSARSGRISSKVVDKKEDNGVTFSKSQTQNVLPSIDLFNSKPNFVTNANTYSYQSEERNTSILDQANNQGAWSSFNTGERQSSPGYENEITSQVDNEDAKMRSRFEANRNISLTNVTEQKKISEGPTESKTETISPPLGAQSVPCVPVAGMMKLNSNSDGFVSPAPKTDIQPELPSSQQRSSTFLCSDEADLDTKMPAPEMPLVKAGRDNEPGIPYEWTNEFFKNYEPGQIEASAKMLIFFCMLDEIIRLGDRLLLFSQSLFTLDLIEDFLHLFNIPNKEEKWARNKNYFRLDGSTTALEREKLINEFNANPNIHLFLVSTRAGSLGINLVGANRVVVFDASWNPCHDTQAVCRVYRYGQQKNCYVYRFVMDNCLEKKIYDRQINKQGMSDRIVDECNPEAHLTMKDVSSLCWDTEDVSESKKDFGDCLDKYNDEVIRKVIEKHGSCLSKEPFIHESLLVDRKETKLSQAEKRMAKRGYELEKQANSKPTYPGFYNTPQTMNNRLGKPMTNVRPMIVEHQRDPIRRWIPPEVWKKQGMSAQEMTLPLDVEIPNSNDSRIVLKAGQKVMVLKSHKGIYMQLENGKIVAIKQHKPGPVGVGGVVNESKIGNMVPRHNSVPLMQGGSSGPMAGANRLIPRPSMLDRTVNPLGIRRDMAISQLRNRFVRPNQGAQSLASLGASIPPISNTMRPHLPPTSRFVNRGPNLVQRSFAGASRPQVGRPLQAQQIQQRQQTQLPLPSTAVGGKSLFGPNSAVTLSVAGNTKKVEQQMSHEKDRMSHLTEVDYSDFNSNRVSPYGDYSVASGDTSTPVSKNMQYMAGRNSDIYQTALSPPARKPQSSNIIPEALRRKREINLTPVVQKSLANANQQHQQPSYQQPLMGKVRPTLSYPSTSKNAETASKNPSVTPSLPKSGSAISIFPVGKKSEESNAQVFEQPVKTGSFYPNFSNKQQQIPQPYQGYQENTNAYFPPGYSQQQSSQSFASYSSSGNEFTTNPYNDGASGDFTSTALSNVSQVTPAYSHYDPPRFYNNNCQQQTPKTDSM